MFVALNHGIIFDDNAEKNFNFHITQITLYSRFPNKDWDREGLYKQLANTGILHALPLAKCKYPIYFPYEEFCKRYCGNHEKFKSKNLKFSIFNICNIRLYLY
jgi:hypothetical protein